MGLRVAVEGLERYPVNLRYKPELRDNPRKLARVLVPTPRGEHIPLGQLARLEANGHGHCQEAGKLRKKLSKIGPIEEEPISGDEKATSTA